MAQSISEAINEVTEDVVEDAEETTEETTSEETSEKEETEGTLLDEEDTEEETEEEESTEEEEETEEETTEEETTEEETPDAGDIFDNLTAEQLAEIKSNPALNQLRKALMKGYNTKTTEHSQLVQLGNAYRQDPYGVLKAIALQLGMDVVSPNQPQQQQQAQQTQAVDPGKELEDLFGEQIGPKVRAVFDKWAEARFGQRFSTEVAPLRDALGRVISTTEAARMQSEEVTFKGRHKDLTPQMEKAIVDLGNSGKIVPGRMTPQEYLDTLYDIVSARQLRKGVQQQQGSASTKLAKRIEANRRDREPVGTSGRGSKVKPVSQIPKAKSIAEALDLAMNELEQEETGR